MIMSREQFASQTAYAMSYDDYVSCYCPDCDKADCLYRNNFERVPEIDGGAGLCPRLTPKGDI